MIIKKVKTMAIKKNKKRFDPRYFMDEKLEEQREQLHAPEFDPREQAEWEEKQREEKEKKKKKDVPRGSADINFTMKEDLSHLADPAVWEALGQGLAKMAEIWVPMIGMAGFAVVASNAFEFLKGGDSAEDAVDKAVQNAKQEAEKGASKEELNEVNEPAVFLSQIQAVMAQTGWYTEEELQSRISAMAELMSPQVVAALETIANNSQAVGDIHMKLGAKALSDGRIDKLEPSTRNLLRILKVLGKYQSEWDR